MITLAEREKRRARLEFLQKATAAAIQANHPFPEYTACEAAEESNYGRSQLAREDNNLFGMKQHLHPAYESVVLPTHEVLNGISKEVSAKFCRYPDWASCFADRLQTLHRLAPNYPHYAAAIAALDGESFIREVSKSWSTDPCRALTILGIHAEYFVKS